MLTCGAQPLPGLPRSLLAPAVERWQGFQHQHPWSRRLPAVLVDSLPAAWALSRYLADTCCRYPEILQDLAASGDLLVSARATGLARRLEMGTRGAGDEAELGRRLRRLRHREMVRIIWRDLVGWADLAETMRDLSWLAEAAIDAALAGLASWRHETGGTAAPRLAVLGMGKLGGWELNVSSDVDLVLIGTAGEPGGDGGAAEPAGLVRQLLRVLGSQTADGHVFRVDLRLRPFGDAGPLVMTPAQVEAYLEAYGRAWERLAWLRARPVAGDRQAGARLLAAITPFVYRRYLDFGALDSLRDLKERLAAARAASQPRDLKLGPGGIRQVEFLVQTLQLIHGGRHAALRTPSVLEALPALVRGGWLSAAEGHGLLAAYALLRDAEHRLQAVECQQTHTLPDDPEAQARLAASLGMAGWEACLARLAAARQLVAQSFAGLLRQDGKAAAAGPRQAALADLWGQPPAVAAAGPLLAELGFQEPDQVLAELAAFRQGPVLRSLNDAGRRRLERLGPPLLAAAGAEASPDQVLGRLLDILRAIGGRSTYLALLAENPGVLPRLAGICQASPWLATQIRRLPRLLDDLLEPDLGDLAEADRWQAAIEAGLAPLAGLDPEDCADSLRRLKQAQILRLALAVCEERIDNRTACQRLSSLAEAILAAVIDLAWTHLVARHGRPRLSSDPTGHDRGILVVAYGTFGAHELAFTSDLDLVFLHTAQGQEPTTGAQPLPGPQFFARLAQRVIHLLVTPTEAGILYPVDSRLRPSGNAGMLVSELASFWDYQATAAWTWEHQALVRARAVAGDQGLMAAFGPARAAILGQPRDAATLRQEVLRMRQRLLAAEQPHDPALFHPKMDPGGMVDIDFLAQYGVLVACHRHPELATATGTQAILAALAEAGVLAQNDARCLAESYGQLRGILHRQALAEEPALVPAAAFSDLRREVRRVWDAVLR
ncbi:MAG: bifunctional [glutamate--ammonia ligase]-adenylyl-L-tyrosine phosphorylase/[glutamate--ammonia-ligase] adenylyltransferase [Thermodesulfobacteriota bacterium]